MKNVQEIKDSIQFIDNAIARETEQMAELVSAVVEELVSVAQTWVDLEAGHGTEKNLGQIRAMGANGIAALKTEIRSFQDSVGREVRRKLSDKNVWAHIDPRASPCDAMFRSLVGAAGIGLLPILQKHHVADHSHWENVDGEGWRPILSKIPDVTAGESAAKYANLDRQVSLRRRALEERQRELHEAEARELWRSS